MPCNGVANAKAFPEALAELPQTPKSSPEHLRNFRKHEKEESGVCGTSASVKMEEMALAELPQTPKSFSRDLRDSRKRQTVFRGPCGTPANTKKFSEALTGTPASISKSNFPPCMFDFWPWRGDRHKKSRACDVESQALLCLSAKNRRTGGRCVVFMSSIQRSQPSAHPPERSRRP